MGLVAVFTLCAADKVGAQHTIDWGSVGFVENDTIDGTNTYFDEVDTHANPNHGLSTASGGISTFKSQTFADLMGSGVDLTIYYSQNMYDQSSSNLWGPNLYAGTDNPDRRVTGSDALRFTRDATADTTTSGGSVRTPFTTVFSFSKPVLLDEFLVASLSQIGDHEHVVVRAFSGAGATGSVVKATAFINESDESDDSGLLHDQGDPTAPVTSNALGNIAVDPDLNHIGGGIYDNVGSAADDGVYHIYGVNPQTSGAYGRAKWVYANPVRSVAVSTFKAGASFTDSNYTASAHSVIMAPLSFTPAPGQLGDFVWSDTNGDGIQDPGEPGIAGVTVNLLDSAGNPTGITTTTDGAGGYGFDGLADGSYIVEFVPPPGFSASPQGAGAPASDSDAEPATGRTGLIAVTAATQNGDIDAGFVPLPPSLALAKSADVSGAEVGETVTYTYTVTNDGGEPLTLSDITDDKIGTIRTSSDPPADLQALYTFEEGSGTTVADVSGVGAPLDLGIENASYSWGVGDVDFVAENRASNTTDSSKIYTAATGSNEISVEAWLTPANNTQTGPARIVTQSLDGSSRNFSLMQEGGSYEVRIRTTTNGTNGANVRLVGGSVATALTHLVFTRDAAGNAFLYVDGTQADAETIGGDFSNWDAGYDFGIGNEFSIPSSDPGRDWQGEFHRVAVYSRALTAGEVSDSFAAGANPGTVLDVGESAIFTAPYVITPSDLPAVTNLADVSGTTGGGGTVDAPQANETVDVIVPVAIGNLVFVDLDGDGKYEPADSEYGVDGVSVELFAQGDDPNVATPVATTVTGGGGLYVFDRIDEGSYFVHIPKENFAGGGALDGLLSSAGAGADAAGDDDADEDGIDTVDPALTGVSSGVHVLVAGGENVGETGTAGYPGALPDSSVDLTADFGFVDAAATVGIGNLIFSDGFGNGRFEPLAGETGIDGVVVELYPAGADPGTASPLAQTITSGGGLYVFTGLPPGSYFVHVPASQFGAGMPLESHVSSPGALAVQNIDDGGGENGLDVADPAAVGVSTIVFDLAVGAEPTDASGEDGESAASDNAFDSNINLTADLGFVPTTPVGGIGNLVFADADGNGVYSSGEGVDGVIVELYDDTQIPGVDPPVASTVTANGGSYLFSAIGSSDGYVHIPASNFAPGGALEGMLSVPGHGADNGSDDNADENGVDAIDPATSGITTPLLSFALGTEPTAATSETGNDAAADDSVVDADFDLTIDFGFVNAADTVGLGNVVFVDADGDGVFDAGEGIDGVTVELYAAGQSTSTAALASTQTIDGGSYAFTGLAPGSYFVHIPASEFGVGAALEGSYSIPGQGGDSGTDDNVDENGIDTPEPATNGVSSGNIELLVGLEPIDSPGTETGNDAASDNAAVDANIDLTVDLGFLPEKTDSFTAWQAGNPLGGQNGPADNPDGDIYSNALEYAFCLKPDSGAPELAPNPGADGGFCIELGGASGSSGTVDAFFTRRSGGFSDVTYTLQTAISPGSPTSWAPWSGPAPSVADNGDGTETVTFADLEANVGAQGIVRLQVDLAGDASSPHFTQTFGWHTQTNTAACETCSYPYALKSVFSGTPGAVSADNLTLTVVGTPSLEIGTDYYIEVLSGIYAGHRFDVAGAAADTVVLNGASPRDTLDPVPDLTGSPLALRPHATLDSIAPPELFAADNDPALGDRILVYEGGAWTTYWVLQLATEQWTDAGDPGASDAGGTVVDAPQGFFLHPKSGDVDVTMTGVVREWPFACPLDAGFNLVGSGYPLDQSPDDRAMERIDGDGNQDWFTGNNDPLQADQLMFWLGDSAPGAEGYGTYFRLDLGIPAYDYWTDQTNSNLADADAELLFELGRGAFYDMTLAHDRSDAAKVWLWPVPWAP